MKNICIDDAFFQSNWAGACWGRWAGLELPLGWSLALDPVLPVKTSDRGGRRRLRPWPLRCLSQFLSNERRSTA